MILNKANSLSNETNKFIYIEVDVDECFDLYAFKIKKMIRGIPSIFLYQKNVYLQSDESHMYIPQASIAGTKENEIQTIINMIQ